MGISKVHRKRWMKRMKTNGILPPPPRPTHIPTHSHYHHHHHHQLHSTQRNNTHEARTWLQTDPSKDTFVGSLNGIPSRLAFPRFTFSRSRSTSRVCSSQLPSESTHNALWVRRCSTHRPSTLTWTVTINAVIEKDSESKMQCVCMRMCMHECAAHVCLRAPVHVSTGVYLWMCACKSKCKHTSTSVCVCVCVYVRACACVLLNVCPPALRPRSAELLPGSSYIIIT